MIYKKYFPFGQIREQQNEAIEFAIKEFDKGKKFVILELGTGCGKSAIGLTLARYYNSNNTSLEFDDEENCFGAYILTTQKILQQQYVDDFGSKKDSTKNLLCSIKSSKNYSCGFYADQSCSESRTMISQLGDKITGTDFFKHCKSNCNYAKEKQKFIDSHVSVTNFSYFFAETMYSQKIKPRDFLIIDECHNIENELGKFVEVSFSEKFSKDVLGLNFPDSVKDQNNVLEFIRKEYYNKLLIHFEKIGDFLEKNIDESSETFKSLSRQYEMLDKHRSKIEKFLKDYQEENWVMNVILPLPGQKTLRKFEFKPIDVSLFSNENLFRFGKKVLLLSATIVDKNTFCKSIGINAEDASFLSIPTPFPVENRPIHFIPAGSMSKNNIDTTLPILSEAVKMLLAKHKGEKGIIHCVNFKIAKYIVENVKNKRLLIHDTENREETLKQHFSSKQDTVLVSPSMTEGVNLSDSYSRFQILCKVPYPYLGDLSVKKRMEKNANWYNYQTAKTIIQAMGRSIRNEKDSAVSYILDQDWDFFLKRNKHLFQKDFLECLK